MRSPRRLLQTVPATSHRHQNYNQAINAGSALLLVFALVLIYWNYLFCRRRRSSPESPTSVAASFPDPKAELEAIAIVVYSGPRNAVADFEAENCAICLAEFEIGENVRVLPRCMHVFHVECIDRWLVVRSLQCPVCRDRTIQAPPQPKKTSCSSSVNDTTPPMIVEFATTRAFAGHIPSYI